MTVALVSAPSIGLASDDRVGTIPPAPSPIWNSAVRALSAELSQAQPDKVPDPGQPVPHTGASMAEKIAFLYLLVGGSVMLIYGPQEKDGDHVSVDGVAEGIAGAASIAISFGLLRDILHKRPSAQRP